MGKREKLIELQHFALEIVRGGGSLYAIFPLLGLLGAARMLATLYSSVARLGGAVALYGLQKRELPSP